MELTAVVSRIQSVEVKEKAGNKTVLVPKTLVALKFRSFDGVKIIDRIEFHVPAGHEVPKVGTELTFRTDGPRRRSRSEDPEA